MEGTKGNKKMLIEVDEKPPIAKWIILAFQHVFAMFGATILVPILVNNAAKAEVLTIPVALVASGIGTLIYILCKFVLEYFEFNKKRIVEILIST